MNLAHMFAQQAALVSNAYGGPYYDALVHSRGEAVYDTGGSILTPGTPSTRTCQAQVDTATQDMRREDGFADGDVRILVLCDTLVGDLTLDNSIEILGGAHIGKWQIQTISRDPFGIYFELRGRRA